MSAPPPSTLGGPGREHNFLGKGERDCYWRRSPSMKFA
jgi:hypothetical protein